MIGFFVSCSDARRTAVGPICVHSFHLVAAAASLSMPRCCFWCFLGARIGRRGEVAALLLSLLLLLHSVRHFFPLPFVSFVLCCMKCCCSLLLVAASCCFLLLLLLVLLMLLLLLLLLLLLMLFSRACEAFWTWSRTCGRRSSLAREQATSLILTKCLAAALVLALAALPWCPWQRRGERASSAAGGKPSFCSSSPTHCMCNFFQFLLFLLTLPLSKRSLDFAIQEAGRPVRAAAFLHPPDKKPKARTAVQSWRPVCWTVAVAFPIIFS